MSRLVYWQPPARPDPPDGPDGPDRSRLVLAIGLVSLVLAPLGIVAWVAGNACLRAIAAGRMDPAGESNARAGRMLGIIATCIFAVKTAALLPWLVGKGRAARGPARPEPLPAGRPLTWHDTTPARDGTIDSPQTRGHRHR